MSAARRITARRFVPVLFLLSALAFVAALSAADDPPATAIASAARAKDEAKAKDESYSTKGKLDEVTVYRGQALVTRTPSPWDSSWPVKRNQTWPVGRTHRPTPQRQGRRTNHFG